MSACRISAFGRGDAASVGAEQINAITIKYRISVSPSHDAMSTLYPNVPDTIGVPAVLRDTPSTNDYDYAPALDQTPTPPAPSDWGVYDLSGTKLVDPDSMVSIETHAEKRIADYPIEGGGFQSYNKVTLPFEVHLVLTKGGSVSDRTAFMNALKQLHASLDLCDVATPERAYTGVNVTRLSQSRSAEAGAGLATVEVVLEEIRETATVAYSTAPAGAAPTNTTTATSAPDQPTPASLAVAKVNNDFWRKGATQSPASALPINQGAVQPRVNAAVDSRFTKMANGDYVMSLQGMK